MNGPTREKPRRHWLLWISSALGLAVLVASVGLRVRAGDDSYRQVSLFSEVLGLVERQYVDPVDVEELMSGAYEGLLASLDAEGAYLDEAGVALWNAAEDGRVGVGIQFVKAFGSLQIVAVDEGSPAAEAGLSPGDQIRTIDGIPTRRLSIRQAKRMIAGEAGTSVRLGMMLPEEDLAREERVLVRRAPEGLSHAVELRDGLAVLRLASLRGLDRDALATTLAELSERGAEALILDLRNRVEPDVRAASGAASVLFEKRSLQRVDRSGTVLETLDLGDRSRWNGPVFLLANRATAGGFEALAWLGRAQGATLIGEPTYGLASVPELFELETGGGLLVSSSRWVAAGTDESWNEQGLEPETEVAADGRRFEDAQRRQLDAALEAVRTELETQRKKEAA